MQQGYKVPSVKDTVSMLPDVQKIVIPGLDSIPPSQHMVSRKDILWVMDDPYLKPAIAFNREAYPLVLGDNLTQVHTVKKFLSQLEQGDVRLHIKWANEVGDQAHMGIPLDIKLDSGQTLYNLFDQLEGENLKLGKRVGRRLKTLASPALRTLLGIGFGAGLYLHADDPDAFINVHRPFDFAFKTYLGFFAYHYCYDRIQGKIRERRLKPPHLRENPQLEPSSYLPDNFKQMDLTQKDVVSFDRGGQIVLGLKIGNGIILLNENSTNPVTQDKMLSDLQGGSSRLHLQQSLDVTDDKVLFRIFREGKDDQAWDSLYSISGINPRIAETPWGKTYLRYIKPAARAGFSIGVRMKVADYAADDGSLLDAGNPLHISLTMASVMFPFHYLFDRFEQILDRASRRRK